MQIRADLCPFFLMFSMSFENWRNIINGMAQLPCTHAPQLPCSNGKLVNMIINPTPLLPCTPAPEHPRSQAPWLPCSLAPMLPREPRGAVNSAGAYFAFS